MNKYHIVKISTNFFAVLVLISLLSLPLFFAKNFAKIAGVKNTASFLVVSQVENFPALKFSQQEDTYTFSFTKYALSQAFLGVLIVNNPLDTTQTYTLQQLSGSVKPFFGENLDNQLTTISIPPSASIPVSLFSKEEATSSNQTVEFTILTN